MSKKLLSFLLAGALALSAAACGQGAASAPQQSSAPQSAASAAGPSSAEAKEVDWPTDTVKIYVAGAAGSNMDLKARLVAKYLGEELGKPVVVENRAGASGITGTTEYLTEEPNTNNIMLCAGAHLYVLPLYNDVSYQVKDFSTVIGMDTVDNGFFVSAKTGVKTLEELKQYGEGRVIKFAAGGAGNDTFLMTKVVMEELGLQSDMVTGKGFAEGLVNCSTGVVDVMYCALNQAKQYVEDGSIIPLAVYNETAYTGYADVGYPSVASFKELGIDAQYSTLSFFVIRAGTDQAVIDKLSGAIGRVYENPEFKKEFEDAGFVMMPDVGTEATEAALKTLEEKMSHYGQLTG